MLPKNTENQLERHEKKYRQSKGNKNTRNCRRNNNEKNTETVCLATYVEWMIGDS